MNSKNTKRKIKIFFAAQDPGGFNAIWPVIKELKKVRRFFLRVFLANQSQDIAKQHGISYQDANDLTEKEIRKIFQKAAPDLIFIATSAGKSIEKKITKAANAQKIKTLALIDFWSNYKLRFSDPKTENLAYLPDFILVIDEIMKRGMLKQGFKPEKIIIVGNPFFDTFTKSSKSMEKKDLITFFSQPFSEIYKKGGRGELGFDEIQVFQDIAEILEKINPKKKIIIKLHPGARSRNKFDKIIKNSKLNIKIEKKLSAEDLIEQSEIILGINSMVLFEAALLGKKVLSYQPNLKKSDCLISNRLKLSAAVYKKKHLYSVLKKLSLIKSKKNVKLIRKYIQNNSTQKVIKFIKNQF